MKSSIVPSTIQLQSYNGQDIQVYGCLAADITLGEIQLPNCIFQIVADNCSPILGTPELAENGIEIDFQGGLIRKGLQQQHFTLCDSPAAAIKIISKSSFFETSATAAESLMIKPHSSTFINVNLSACPTSYICAIPERISKNKTFEVYDQCLQLHSLQEATKIQISNNSSLPIHIKQKATICKISEVEVSVPDQAVKGKFETIMKELSIGDAPTKYRRQLEELISQYTDVFAIEDEKLGTTDAMSYKIDTGDAAPVASQRYKTPYYLRKELKKIIDANLKSGLLEPCSSPWAAPVLLVKKANGKWRLVCDYRKLNTVTIANQYPLPDIDGLIDQMAESTVFSTADLFTGFHQIPCDPETKQKVAITTDFGQFTWTAMPMGGKNAPAVFQRMMDKLFSTIPNNRLAIYLDDLCLHSKTYEDNLFTIEQMLRILRKNNLKIRAAKTEFLKPRIKFCGAILENGFRYLNPDKTRAVRELGRPQNKKEAASVFGLLNYHRTFIPHFASKAAPINKAMSKGFKWTHEADEALELLKAEIGNFVDALKIPNPNTGEFAIETDASEKGIGAVLLYKKDSNSHFQPAAYLSQKFDDAQKNYNISENELLAGKKAMEKWSHYLLGRQFLWFTDNSCVNWAHRIMSRKLKIAKWLAEISDFDFKTVLKPSKQMVVSDCLSRFQAADPEQKIEVNMVKPSEFIFLQESDPVLCEIMDYQTKDRWPTIQNEHIKPFSRLRSKLMYGEHGELGISKNGFKAIPPKALHTDILEEYHDNTGHPGVSQTLAEIENKYFYPSMRETVAAHIKSCTDCQRIKPVNNPLNAPLGHVKAPAQPFERYSVDLIGPLPLTDNHMRYICVSTDLFSKRTNATALRTKEPDEVLAALKNEWLRNPHLPREVLMDNGGEFKEVKDYCVSKGLKVSLSPAYHPQTNGECENRNRTLKSRLKLACKLENWDLFLPEAIHQMNSAKHSVTKLSPFEIETGYPGENPNDKYKITQNRRDVNLQNIEEKIQNNHNKRKSEDEKIHDFKKNDLVLCKNTSPYEKIYKWMGPMRITEVRKQGLSFTLLNLESGRELTRHISHIKPFIQRESSEISDGIITSEKRPKDHKNELKTHKKRERIPYTIMTRSIKRDIERRNAPLASSREHQETTLNTDSRESEASQTEEPAASDQQTPNDSLTPINDPSNETVFYDCDSPTTTQEDNQSTDSNGQEVEFLTNKMEEEPKPRKLISPIVQRIAELHDRALDKFIKDYKCNIKITSWSALQNKKAKKLEKINEWIRLNHKDWEKDDDGFYLIKHNALMLDAKCYLSSFTILELKVLAKHMGLDIETTLRPKTAILAEFKTKAKEKFPFMKCTPSGNLIIDPAHFT